MEKTLTKYIIFLPLFTILFSLFIFHSLSNDAVQYSTLGYNLFHNGFYNDPYGVVPGWIQSPGWAILVGLLSSILSVHIAANLGTAIVSAASLFLLYYFVRKNFNTFIASLTVGILLINPLFLIGSRQGLAEPFYAFQHLILFIVVYQLFIERKPVTLSKIVLFSTVSVCLFLTRSEGILYIFLIFIILLWTGIKNISKADNSNDKIKSYGQYATHIFQKPLSYLLLAGILTLPYGYWIEGKSDSFDIAPKLKFNKRIGEIPSLLHPDKKLFLTDEELFSEIAWFGLDTVTTQLYSSNILNDQYYQNIHTTITSNKSILILLVSRIARNVKGVFEILIRSNPFPLIFLLFILYGLVSLFRSQRKLFYLIFIWLIPAFYFIVSHVEERFFYIFLPYLSFIAAYGLYNLGQRFKKPILFSNIALVLLLCNAALYYYDYWKVLEQNEVYYQVAQVLKKDIPDDAKVCAKSFSPTFFSDRDFAKIPYCSPGHLSQYMNKQKADYLLLGEEVQTFRKQFKPIYEGEETVFFDEVKKIKTEFQTFKLFKVK